MTMCMMAELDESGDTKVIWDTENEAEVAAAREMFERLVTDGNFAAFKAEGKDGHKGKQIRKFDPEAERIILVPPMVGG